MSKKVALIIMFFILGTILIFHFLIFTEQIPYEKVWAGKLNSVEEMKSFETFSILINVFMLVVLFIKYKQLEREKTNKVVDILIWIFVAFFALNTLGNLFAQSMIELILGGLLTLISSILCFIIVKKNRKRKHNQVDGSAHK
jgi:NADH:ubiquinone oxidoreductase subunit 2 (subunit N)